MSNIQLIGSLTLYILSVALAILLAITGKKHRPMAVKPFLITHLFLFSLFLILYISAASPIYIRSAFLLFFCSGIVLAGITIRSRQNMILRFYPLIYFISILFFIFSPSFTIRIITFNWQEPVTAQWKLYSNYYLEEEQRLMKLPDSSVTYKITRQYGLFHKTLARNVHFQHRIDSVKTIGNTEEALITLRGYYNHKHDIFEACDSMDISVPFVTSKNTIIQKRDQY